MFYVSERTWRSWDSGGHVPRPITISRSKYWRPKELYEWAKALARHSDIRLTLGVYTHVDLPDQTAAIAALPAPPSWEKTKR